VSVTVIPGSNFAKCECHVFFATAQFLRPREVPSFALDDVFESLPASGGQPDFQEDDFPAPGQASNASISWGKMKVKKGKGKWKKGKGKAKALLGTDEAKEDSKPQATGPENELQSGDLPKKRAVFHRERTDSDRARSEKAIEVNMVCSFNQFFPDSFSFLFLFSFVFLRS